MRSCSVRQIVDFKSFKRKEVWSDLKGSKRAFHELVIWFNKLFLLDKVLEKWGCKIKPGEVRLFISLGETFYIQHRTDFTSYLADPI